VINDRFGNGTDVASGKLGSKASLRGEHTNIFHGQYFKHWLAGLPKNVEASQDSPLPTIIAVGGGKGGVGKSIVSSNVSAKLAGAGHKVLTIDLDIGGSNLHTYFGRRVTSPSLTEFISDPSISFQSIITESGIDNVSLITSGQTRGLGSLKTEKNDMTRVWDGIVGAKALYGFDTVVVDLGAGTDEHTTDFFLAAHIGVVTVLPEPTSIENAYSFLKAVLWKLIQNSGARVNQSKEAEELADRIFSANPEGSCYGYLQKLLAERENNPKLINCIVGAMMGRKMGFVVNQIRSQKDIEIANSMADISKNYFGWKTLSLGFLNYDEAAWKALRNKKLLVQDFPHSMISRRLDDFLVRAIDGLSKL
jgi:flagellar biosynthesis protein FlhG